MCGRFSQNLGRHHRAILLFRRLPVSERTSLVPRFNVAPTQSVPVVLQEPGKAPTFQDLHWGLIPSWSADRSIGVRCINARCETVAVKPAFREAYRFRRCLVPASGFYEWKTGPDKSKTPYYFTPADPDYPLAFAGVWERWQDGDEEVRSFAIVTTDANAVTAPFHDRMPVIVAPEDWEVWLDPAITDRSRLDLLLRPAPDDLLHFWEVSPYVNTPRNEGEECIRPKEQ
ncbi:MAG: SOS response-associated peptidase [Planctomycetes bacterium]|nr:SOS response-associated peptidase [Planctomycetota bacterium]